MALHAALPRPALRVWWGALVVVPVAFAGLGLALFPLQAAPTPPAPRRRCRRPWLRRPPTRPRSPRAR